jgi:hypothetical protein
MICKIRFTYGESLIYKQHRYDVYGLTYNTSNYFSQWSEIPPGWGCLDPWERSGSGESSVHLWEETILTTAHALSQAARVWVCSRWLCAVNFSFLRLQKLGQEGYWSDSSSKKCKNCEKVAMQLWTKQSQYIAWDTELIHVLISSNRENRFRRQSCWPVFRRCLIRIFYAIRQILQANFLIIPWNKIQLPPSISSPIHNSLLILPSEVLKMSLNKEQRKHYLVLYLCTSRKLAGSISDEVIEFFNWPNPSSRAMALGLTRLQTEGVPRIFL